MIGKEIINTSKHVLGPLFYRFCYKHYLASSLYDPSDTKVLFLARGGVRIGYFYKKFLQANNIAPLIEFDDFYVSRMSVLKACLLGDYERFHSELLKEYYGLTLSQVVTSFFGVEVYQMWQAATDKGSSDEVVSPQNLYELIFGDSNSSLIIHEELCIQNKRYLEYLESKVGDSHNVIIVDTGWSGSILNYMQTVDPDREYTAHFFGRYNYGSGWLPWFDRVIGLEVEDNDYHPKKPVTSIFMNRHLIEGVCEINWPSTVGYSAGERGAPGPMPGVAPESKIEPSLDEPQAIGIIDYIDDSLNGLNPSAIQDAAQKAALILRKRILYPRKQDLDVFSVGVRSADFGKTTEVPMLLPSSQSRFGVKGKISNIRKSLWRPGQIRVEFGYFAVLLQYLLVKYRYCVRQ
jgi:hypothetical protein